MNTALSPLISEFDSTEQEAHYTEWLRTKVAASINDPRPAVPHDEVMAEMDSLIDQIASEKGTVR
ncbi:antitoxin [Enterobacter kobei]|uniref:type II toxin-antitoxin system RelB family antitoxin n=1 Tax=Enterobacter kobei TaxID=208224 RepID=UPI003CF49BDB